MPSSRLSSLLCLAASLIMTACVVVPPGHVKKNAPPGQVQQQTGCNPASGKCKAK